MEKKFRLMIIIMTFLIGTSIAITFPNEANAEELYDPYPVQIAPVGDKVHFKHGDEIEFLMKFSTPVSCDQYSETPALRFLDANDNLISLEWYGGVEGRYSTEENHYFKFELTGNEADGKYSLYDFDPNTCETPEGAMYYSGNSAAYFQSLFGHIVIDNVAPEVESARVTTNTAHQIVFNAGETIDFEVTLNEPAANPEQLSLQLNNGGVAPYSGNAGDRTLQFSYVVEDDQDIGRLDTVQLEGTLKDLAGNQAAPSAKQITLSNNPGIIIDTTAPVITVDPPSGSDYAKTHDIQLQIADRDAEPTVFHLWNQSSAPPSNGEITGIGAASGQLLPQPDPVSGDMLLC